MRIKIEDSKYYKYKIIEYAYSSMTYGKGGTKVEVCKTLHRTNSKLIFILIKFILKIQRIKYEVVD